MMSEEKNNKIYTTQVSDSFGRTNDRHRYEIAFRSTYKIINSTA